MKQYIVPANLLIIAILALTACVPLPQAPTPPPSAIPAAPGAESLAGATWTLTHYGPTTAPLNPPGDAAPTLIITGDGQVSGNAGCNSYFGALTVTDDTLSFGQMGRTLMACEDARMALEDAYLAALADAERFTVADGLLTIRYLNGDSALVFARTP